MSDAERRALEEDVRLLKLLMDFHIENKESLGMTEAEHEAHIPESLVHPLFLPYFRQYMALESEDERKDFWKTRKINSDVGTIKAAWLYGINMIAEEAKDLERRIIAAQFAEQH